MSIAYESDDTTASPPRFDQLHIGTMPTSDIEVYPQDVHIAGRNAHSETPKDEQHAGLRRVAGPIPWLLFLICVVEVWPLCPRSWKRSILMLHLVWRTVCLLRHQCPAPELHPVSALVGYTL
jgi:hypothetical protein